MNTPYSLDTLYSGDYSKKDLHRLLKDQGSVQARGVIIRLNERGTESCLMLDSYSRRETLVGTCRSNQFLMIPAFHWRILANQYGIDVIESNEIPASRKPADLYAVARSAWASQVKAGQTSSQPG